MFKKINIEQTKRLFSYDAESGNIFWKEKTRNTKAGMEKAFFGEYASVDRI